MVARYTAALSNQLAIPEFGRLWGKQCRKLQKLEQIETYVECVADLKIGTVSYPSITITMSRKRSLDIHLTARKNS